MGDIYRNCRKVLACVGPHAEDSSFLYLMLSKHSELFASAGAFETYWNFTTELETSLQRWRQGLRFSVIKRLLRALPSLPHGRTLLASGLCKSYS